ncbi:MAG: HAMP domain-containing histidine kinase [Leptolyngbyaceae cyanobacterium HOT.MB2.61]|jgi:signal transduction histidine kinase|nr:HAMP domain-containing histidine kinase [Leptolyngbyaceae cyanobacterium HOT.MB2.61]
MSFSFNNEPLLPRSSPLEPDPIPYADPELMNALMENQALKEQIARQTQFMHLMTHQLATPLTSLSGSVDLLAEPGLDAEHRQEFLNVVKHQVHRLQDLLNDLTTIRNLETGALKTHPVGFSLPKLLEEIVEAYRPYPIVCQWHTDLPQVWGDRWQISQILINLVSNAIKYSPNGTPVEVGVSELPSGWVEVWVRDRGLGIPLPDQPHVFERFYRVKHRDRCNIQGTGLGLSLCKLLVENQGGQMGFESVHGQGSRFYFTLPVAREMGSTE